MKPLITLILATLLNFCPQTAARAQAQRALSGTIVTGRNEAVAGATITVRALDIDIIGIFGGSAGSGGKLVMCN